MRINQNIAAFNAYRNLVGTGLELTKSLDKLSSGFRISKAADDAAGLVKSEKLRAEIRGSRQAVRNAQDGVSFVQTAEGALNEVHSILQRMRELAVDAANTATTDGVAQQAEITELLAELDAIGTNTTFSGQQVFQDYSVAGSELTFHVGANADAGGGENIMQISSDLGMAAANVFGEDLSAISVVAATGDANAAILDIDDALDAVSSSRATLGATQNRMEHVIANLNVAITNLSASESRVRDVDMAEEMVEFTRHQIMQQAGTAMLAQANQVPFSVLTLLQ